MSAIKIVIMGVGGVGKSAITRRFTRHEWTEGYNPTVEDTHFADLAVDGQAVSLELLDTAGQEEFSALRQTFMHTGDGFVMVYSITNDSTFTDLAKIREQVLKVHQDKNVPMILVGNKCDLEGERAVLANEAKRVASEWGAAFIEASAKSDTNVTKLFETLVRNILQHTNDPTKGGGGGAVLGAGQTPAKPPPPPKKKCVML